uniref:LEM domain-containing protein n=1 Tax=Gouania willdenowi TaxID=441366 RepID=A0A8C5DPL4_GOUWI
MTLSFSLCCGRSVQLLLSAGAHPDMVGRKGVAAIHLAVGKESEKNTRCLRLLLRQGANPNIRSAEGLTPLHVAALWGCFQNIKLLLMNGGNPNIKDDEGNTPQQLAEQQENRKCALLLQEYQSSSVEKEDEDLPQFHYCEKMFLSILPSFRGMPSSRPSGASLLSSTRMSEMGLLKNDSLFTDHGTHLPKDKALTAPNEGIASPSRRDNLPVFSSFRTSRKSVSFNNIDEHFPVFSPESPKQHPGISASPSVCTLPFDMSDYSDFLDTERMATVLDTQGIDVTSPDHVYVFCRESSESTEEDLEKTVIRPRVLEESDDEQEGEDVKVIQMNVPDKNASSDSSTGPCENSSSTHSVDQLVPASKSTLHEASAQSSGLKFTPSPFVTGRTCSRLSRCSMKTSRTESLNATSLFDDTLPTPVRSCRKTPRSQSSKDTYGSPQTFCNTSSMTGGVDKQDSQSCAHTLGSSVSNSQADTFILPKGDCTSDSASVSASASSSSSSSYFSPRRSNEDHLPCSQGTGCTPRYSMSRLSSRQRPQSLASLSYTPGGRPLIRDLDEPVEYLYTDTEQGHRLIETHVPPTSSEETVLYDWRSILLKETRGLTDKKLRQKLVELGESPGPISSRTRPTYMRRLCRLLQDSNSQSQHDLGYSPELCRVLRTFNLPDCNADEQALCQQFDQPDQNRKWREGKIKSSFNYLLLDPRVTKNLPFRSNTMTPHECFQTFIHAIFYVGKGKRSRPYSHLYEALEYFKGDKTAKKLCPKVQHILQVWNAGQGVISLHCFQNVIPVEAYTREACMVEAISLKMLTNQKRGDFYGVVSNWQGKRKREVGVHLLYRAMQIFLAEGERQLRPADIRQ